MKYLVINSLNLVNLLRNLSMILKNDEKPKRVMVGWVASHNSFCTKYLCVSKVNLKK